MANTDTHITFAIPYYSGKELLREAIASVVAQTDPHWKLVVVDDCSAEPADDIVTELADPRMSYLRNESNLGMGENWNTCLRAADTELVTELHQDDLLHPQYVEKVVPLMLANPDVPVLFTDAGVLGEKARRLDIVVNWIKARISGQARAGLIGGDDDAALIAFGDYVIWPTLCFRPSLLPTNPFRAEWKQATDWFFLLEVLTSGQRMYHLPEKLLSFRRHSSNLTSSNTATGSRFVEELAVMRHFTPVFEQLGWKKSARTAKVRLTLRAHIFVAASVDLITLRPGAAWWKLRLLGRDLLGRPLT